MKKLLLLSFLSLVSLISSNGIIASSDVEVPVAGEPRVDETYEEFTKRVGQTVADKYYEERSKRVDVDVPILGESEEDFKKRLAKQSKYN